MYEEVIKKTGANPGPKSVVFAGIHGNEKCGVLAFEKVLKDLNIENGEVTFVYGNPRAIEQDVRFTEVNLNRMFKPEEGMTLDEKNSYEYNRAQYLKQFLNQSDFLLDIHASFTLDSKPFVICEPNANDIVQYLPFDLVVHGFDEHEPGGTDYYMNKIGKIGICVECGYLGDTKSTDIAVETIYSFLKAVGHIESVLSVGEKDYISVYYLYHTKTDNFRITKDFRDFEEIMQGTLIAMDGDTEVRADRDCYIIFARNRNKIGDEGFLLAAK
ncbi:MAG: succinylglutamate desuccinylase/aspartoacylase family protein [Patescibacteria group bacterium]